MKTSLQSSTRSPNPRGLGAAATLWQSDEYADKAEELLAFQEKLSEGPDRFLQISVESDSESLFCFVGDLVIGSKC